MKKKAHSAEFKFKVVLEAIRWQKTRGGVVPRIGVVSVQIFKWKQVILSRGTEVFRKGFGFEAPKDMDLEKLDATIGRPQG
jgi:transposase-like protein